MSANVKNSNIELDVLTELHAHLKASSKSYDDILLNHGYTSISLYLTLPEEFDVKGPDFDDFCKRRMMYYMPGYDIQKHLKSTVVKPQSLDYDLVVTYARKDPVFIELNNFYHYETKDKMNSLEELARQLANDYAKEYFIRKNGYQLLWIRTQDVELSECVKAICKRI